MRFCSAAMRSIAAGQAHLSQAFDALGLQYLPSMGNFILVKVADDAQGANAINDALLRRGIIVRPVANYGLPHWLRVSIGLPEENDRFVRALRDVLAQGA